MRSRTARCIVWEFLILACAASARAVVTISAVAPSSGSFDGGARLSISGSGFQSGAAVSIGGTAASNVFFNGPGSLFATVPSGSPGAADVTVTNPDNSAATLSGGFTYVPYGLMGIHIIKSLDASLAEMADEETWLGKRDAVYNFYEFFCDGKQSALIADINKVWSHGEVPFLSLGPADPNPSDANGCQPWGKGVDDLDNQITSGAYDVYISSLAGAIKAWLAGPDGIYGNGDDRRIYIRYGWEMSGDWYDWSETKGSSPGNLNADGSYVTAWRHVWTIFNAAGLDKTRLQWVWCLSGSGGPNNRFPPLHYYPGDAYVDWLGVDGYVNEHRLDSTPDQIFGPTLSLWNNNPQTISPSKPRSINEYSYSDQYTGQGGNNKSPATKSVYMYTAGQYFLANNVRMAVMFDEATSSTEDYDVFCPSPCTVQNSTAAVNGTAYNVTSGFYDSMVPSSWIPSSGAGRLLTDAQFQGNFADTPSTGTPARPKGLTIH